MCDHVVTHNTKTFLQLTTWLYLAFHILFRYCLKFIRHNTDQVQNCVF